MKHVVKQDNVMNVRDAIAALQSDVAQARPLVEGELVSQMGSHVALIPEVAAYLVKAGGKRIRPLLLLACCKQAGGNLKDAVPLAVAVEFIHTATLLHDDVVDESEQRRGQRAVHKVFGNKEAILVGDFLFSRAFTLMVRCGDLNVLGILSQAATTIAEGEVMQLQTAQTFDLRLEDYMTVVDAKTAALFSAACESGALIGGASAEKAEQMARFGRALGRAFQIVDDVLDYEGSTRLGKNMGDDFREGKVTLPALLAIAAAKQAKDAAQLEFWHRCITTPQSQTAEDFLTAQAYLQTGDILSQCRRFAEEEVTAIIQDLNEQANRCSITRNLQALAAALPTRKS